MISFKQLEDAGFTHRGGFNFQKGDLYLMGWDWSDNEGNLFDPDDCDPGTIRLNGSYQYNPRRIYEFIEELPGVIINHGYEEMFA
jgi:hypothetical protein